MQIRLAIAALATVADGLITLWALTRGAVELNPMLAAGIQRWGAWATMGLRVFAGLLLLLWISWAARRSRHGPTVITLAAGVLVCVVAFNATQAAVILAFA